MESPHRFQMKSVHDLEKHTFTSFKPWLSSKSRKNVNTFQRSMRGGKHSVEFLCLSLAISIVLCRTSSVLPTSLLFSR